MIPCHICGKDASLGWIKGFAPAPDSQKMALCPEHDTEDNRRRLITAWHLFMIRRIQTTTRISAYQATRGNLHLLTVHFSGGGSLSMPCLQVSETKHGTLKAESPEGEISFFPMAQIRKYDLTPLFSDFVGKLTLTGVEA